MPPDAPRVHPHQALAVYAETLASGATVVVFGDASSGLGERLIELGARSVSVLDPDADRARRLTGHAAVGVSIAPYAADRVIVGGVDLAIVADLGLFERPSELVARLKALVGADGVVLLAAQNRDASVAPAPAAHGFEYYELFDLVAGAFKYVTMLAELPFRGVALVALGEEAEAAVSVDTQLAGEARSPQRFLVTASQRDVVLEPYMVVELPTEPSEPVAPRRAEAPPQRVTELSAAVEAASRKYEAAEARASTVERDAAQAAAAAAGEVKRFEEMLRDRAKAARALEVELERRDRMVRELVASMENGVDALAPAPPAVAPPVDHLSAENARLRELLDAMAVEAARREGDIRSLSWTIAELERRLKGDVTPGAGVEGRDVATESR
jgi:hypothetical protein